MPRPGPLTFLLAPAALLAFSAGAEAQTPYSGHGAASVPADVIARYAPKPLPPELARHIQSMMDVRAPGLGQPSPDGTKLYFGWSVTGTPQVWRLDGPDRFPVQLTGGEDRTTIADVFPDGKTLALQRDRKGEENPGLYLRQQLRRVRQQVRCRSELRLRPMHRVPDG